LGFFPPLLEGQRLIYSITHTRFRAIQWCW